MAIIDCTTLARVKLPLKIETSDTSEDTYLSALITATSQRFELYLDRPIEVVSRTEEYDIADGRQQTLFLRSYPVSSVTTVKNATDWDFANATAWDSDTYHLDAENGQLHLRSEPAAGPKAMQVVYTGGMAADTAALIAAFPMLAQACDLQVVATFRRRSAPQGQAVAGKLGGSITHEGPLKLIPEVKEILNSLRRYRFGV